MSSSITASTSELGSAQKWKLLTISPRSPLEMDWATHYPQYFSPLSDSTTTQAAQEAAAPQKEVEWADVGCGFGGLLMALAPQFPDTLMLGESCPPAAFLLPSERPY